MSKKLYMSILIMLLVAIFLILGNLIYKISMKHRINLEDVYLKNKAGNYTILVEVHKKQLKLIDRENESIVKTYPIATGKPSSPTPLGTFKIIEKAQWGEGFGTRRLGLNVPWGKYGIHGTNRPESIGGNLSAGCIRMRNRDVEELYSMVGHNTTVVIVNGLYGPFGQGFRVIKPGDRGSDVLEVQKRLKQKGYYEGSLDGIYGEGMKSALIKFIKDNNLPLTDKISGEIYSKLDIILME
ncbi:MAG: L,D-transpeptidase family protein [Tissierellia bacterium]|nr:L,D-transpeptidase family protein [Tissierellia bacterium]